MSKDFMGVAYQFIYALRLLIAAICGLAIGFERKNRLKEAGMRTHMIVAIGAAMMMIVSKYGFFDLLGCSELVKYDASRIASQIVSGIGFLGAGMIFIRNRSVTGLTTAAGVWATAGIGMAIGSGMYSLGVIGTLFILAIQYFLHGTFLRGADALSLVIRIDEKKGSIGDVLRLAQDTGAQLVDMSSSHKKSGLVKLDVRLKLPAGMEQVAVIEKIESAPYVVEVEE